MSQPSTNHFKFGASGILSATRGGFSVGVTGGADYGPTSDTGFWNGVKPPVGGYTIYVDKASQGPSIHVASDDAQCITILKAMGATGTTISDVLTWANGQSNMAILSAELTLGDLPGGGGGPQYTYLANFGSTPDSAACFSTNGLTNVSFDSGDIGTAGNIYADNINTLSGGIYWIHDSVSGKVRGASYAGSPNNYMSFFGSYTMPC